MLLFSHSVMSDSLSPHDCSAPGFPVLHHLPEFAQTHVHCVSDAIQTSRPLSSPSPPASVFPSIRVFSNESVLCIRRPKYWSSSFSISPSNEHPGLISLGWTGWISLQSKDPQESSPTPQFKSINSSVLCILYRPILTFIHDYYGKLWKNHSFD